MGRAVTSGKYKRAARASARSRRPGKAGSDGRNSLSWGSNSGGRRARRRSGADGQHFLADVERPRMSDHQNLPDDVSLDEHGVVAQRPPASFDQGQRGGALARARPGQQHQLAIGIHDRGGVDHVSAPGAEEFQQRQPQPQADETLASDSIRSLGRRR